MADRWRKDLKSNLKQAERHVQTCNGWVPYYVRAAEFAASHVRGKSTSAEQLRDFGMDLERISTVINHFAQNCRCARRESR